MTRLGIEVANKDDWVCPSRLLNKLKDLEQLAVTAMRVRLYDNEEQRLEILALTQESSFGAEKLGMAKYQNFILCLAQHVSMIRHSNNAHFKKGRNYQRIEEQINHSLT